MIKGHRLFWAAFAGIQLFSGAVSLPSIHAQTIQCGKPFRDGMRNYNEGEFDAAKSYFQDTARSSDNIMCKIDAIYKIAEISIADSPPRMDEAVEQFVKILEIKSDYTPGCKSGRINRLLCEAYYTAKSAEAADNTEQTVDDLYEECGMRFERKDYREAITLCEEIVIKYPEHLDAYIIIARSYYNMEDRYNAERMIANRLLKIEPDHIEGNLLFARIKLEESIDKAFPYIEKTLRLDPDNGEAHYLKGIVFFKKSQYTQALENFYIALKTDPYNPSLYYLIGETYMELGRLPDAVMEYESAVLLDTENSKFRRALEKVNKKIGNSSATKTLRHKK